MKHQSFFFPGKKKRKHIFACRLPKILSRVLSINLRHFVPINQSASVSLRCFFQTSCYEFVNIL